jgi:hypothetical protein
MARHHRLEFFSHLLRFLVFAGLLEVRHCALHSFDLMTAVLRGIRGFGSRATVGLAGNIAGRLRASDACESEEEDREEKKFHAGVE